MEINGNNYICNTSKYLITHKATPNISQYAAPKTYGLNADVFTPSVSRCESVITKKEVENIYNKIFDECKNSLSKNYGNIQIIKPKCVFDNTNAPIEPGYSPSNNEISFSHKFLNSDIIVRTDSNIWDSNADGNVKTVSSYFISSNKEETKNTLENNENYRLVTKEEKKAILANILRHELEHAAQIQCSLNIDGVLESFSKRKLESLGFDKEEARLPEVQSLLKEHYPFLYSYQPQKKIDKNTNLEILKKTNIDFEDFKKDSLVSTDDISHDDYYSNINEILARNAEIDFWEHSAKKIFPNISDDFMESHKVAAKYNMSNGLLYRKENNN